MELAYSAGSPNAVAKVILRMLRSRFVRIAIVYVQHIVRQTLEPTRRYMSQRELGPSRKTEGTTIFSILSLISKLLGGRPAAYL